MNNSLLYPVLARLLAQNNQVHDWENQLHRESLPPARDEADTYQGEAPLSRIAVMQDEIDQGVRASLVTSWFGLPDDPI